jgi:predicted TIM-barrel fold metal-dependent hydrolase
MSKLFLVSSDGHAAARMKDYRDYLDPRFRQEFEAFCELYEREGTHNFDPPSLRERLDGDVVDEWIETVLTPGRHDGQWNAERRVREMEAQGVCGEVVIPDFGLPFELYSPALASIKGYVRDQEHIDAGNRAYNRWLVDFISSSPERYAGMAALSFVDIDVALKEIEWMKEAGLKGVMMPMFDEVDPLFGERFDPIWSALAENDLVVNSHISISSTSTRVVRIPVAHPAQYGPIWRGATEFYCKQVLDHLIWGGVLDRHPRLKVVFTEQGSGWIPAKLESMDHSYLRSYLRRDIRDVVRLKPSEYFDRQCWIGSSLLSRAEVEDRHHIGVDKMMVGVDYPHHEGMWAGGTQAYLQATFGAAGVPEDEAAKMMGETAIEVFGFDRNRLAAIANRIGPDTADVLTQPESDAFPRGDLHKPLSGSFTF